MPTFRSDLGAVNPYVPGRPIDEVATEIGIPAHEIVKLASNESPDGPFPGVIEAAAAALVDSNRYPDNDLDQLSRAMATITGVKRDRLWFGAGSTGLITVIGAAVGGPGTSAVYAWPSFVMYRIVSRVSMTEPIEVPLDKDHKHDLAALRSAVREDTTVVYLCNPNNPTGTVVPVDGVRELIDFLPESVLIVIDEAYHHYVDDQSYETLIPIAVERPNVLVLRTFSKVYGLATHRVGVAFGMPETLSSLRKAQPPFSVGQVAQVAATASLGNDIELQRRVAANAQGRRFLLDSLQERAIVHTPSQTNFVYLNLGMDSSSTAAAFTRHGVIIRPMSRGWLRVTVGNREENAKFVEVLDLVLDTK